MAAAVALVLFAFGLRAVLPEWQRGRLRAPLTLLAAQLVFSVAAMLLPERSLPRRYLGIAALLLLLLAVGRLATVFFIDLLLGRRRELPRIVRDIVQGVLVIVAVLVTMRRSGVDTTSLLTTSALLTAIVGLSLQDTLGNLIAGLSLQSQEPFAIGEWVQIDREGLQVGQVLEINWRATRLRTLDDAELTVPNAQLARAALLNYSRPTGKPRRTVLFAVPSDVPTRRVHDVVSKAVASVPGVLAHPAPAITTTELRETGVQYAVRFFISDPSARESVEGEVRDRVCSSLARAGLALASVLPPSAARASLSNAPDAHPLAERAATIRRIDFLQDLPESAIETLASGARSETYQPGEIVVRQGELGGALYLCLSGELVVVHTPPNGRPRELAHLQAGGMFGELSVMSGEPRSATVQAVSMCTLAVIERHTFAEVLQQSPTFAEAISGRMAVRQASIEAIDRETTPQQQRESIAQHKQRFLHRLRE
ncbi:MAG TPA: mechanosensitive ion channel family protein, partial [Polyangiales bacterium]|nr:mechanosensitive ion channel family protein [Polyangiales bacterium]